MKLRYALAANLLVLISAVPLAGYAQPELIIESRKEGKNNDKYSEPAGSWIDSNNPPTTAKSGATGLTPQGSAGSRKFLLKEPPTGDPNQILAVARFAPGFTAPGHYWVYSTWPKAGNAAPVQYVVKHARGETAVPITQDGFGYTGAQNANEWVLLGDFDFAAGADQFVEIRATGESKSVNPNPRDVGQIFADGLRFNAQPLPEGMYITAAGAATGLPTGPPGVPAMTPSAPAPPAFTPYSQPPPSTPAAYTPPSTPAAAAPSRGFEWQTTIEAGLQAASRTGKKIFVFFYSPEGNRSRRYEQTVFEDPQVKQLLQEKFVLVRINLLENAALAGTMRVFKAGTINIYDAKGEGIDQITDTLSASELAAKLRSY